MEMGNTQLRKYEEYAYVLDYESRAKSPTVRGRTGIIVVALGEERLTPVSYTHLTLPTILLV